MVLPPQGSSGLSTPGPETPQWDNAVQKSVSLPPSGLPTVLPSHASAPGVPGGPAAAETVAPLPGAVDEAQGVFKFLLDGSFMDGLVRKVYLVDGFPPRAQGSQEPVQLGSAAQVDDPRLEQLWAILGELLGAAGPR